MVFEHLRRSNQQVDPESLEHTPFDSYEPLIHTMMVCHKWYAVALEEASLWTDVDYSHGRAGPTCLLQRSGATPIHLRFVLKGSTEDKQYLCDVVRTNAFRLYQLDLHLVDLDAIHAAGQLLEDDMPLLQRLNISNGFYRKPLTASRKTLGNFLSLRGMILLGFLWLPAPGSGPLTKLTHLHMSVVSAIPVAEITALLGATPALEVLELHACFAVDPTKLPESTTTLERLTSLTVRRMFTRVAEVLMPALLLPRAAVVCLWFDVDTVPTNAILPQPSYWRDATHVRVEDDPQGGILVELEGGGHRLALSMEWHPSERQPLWPLPVPTLFRFPDISTAHLIVSRSVWEAALPQFVARLPALVTLVVEAQTEDETVARQMAETLRDVLQQQDPVLCPGLRELALISSCLVQGLTDCLAPALKKRKRDGRQVERLSTWIDKLEIGVRDAGDALEEYVGSGEVEHVEGAFWPRNEELWRQENEFWEVSNVLQ
ncbi:hypothetical protein V8D89_007628 [Ganoderma adspersum]